MVVHDANNDVLISSDASNLHFCGKAVFKCNDGGSLGSFPNYNGVNDTNLDGRVIYSYSIKIATAPVVFIKPSFYGRWHALVNMENIGGSVWTFKVMVSGNTPSTPPELYCFVPAKHLNSPSETHGMLVYNNNNNITFDSRLQPLALTDSDTFTPPVCPINDGCPGTTTGHALNFSSLDWDFSSSDAYVARPITGVREELMFAAPSIAQAAYKRQMHGSDGVSDSTAMWWALYRAAFRIRDGYLDCGWLVFQGSYAFRSNSRSNGWYGGGDGSYDSGTMPYKAKYINLTEQVYTIANHTRYDDTDIVVDDGLDVGDDLCGLTRSLGGFSHTGHTSWMGSVGHTIGTINAPANTSLYKIAIVGKGAPNIKSDLTEIKLGGVSIWTGSSTELRTDDDGTEFTVDATTAATIPSGSISLELFVSTPSAEVADIIEIRNVKFYFL